MTSTTVPTVSTTGVSNGSVRPVWRTGVKAGVVAALATSAAAAVAGAGEVPLEIGGEAIPALGFGQVTLMCVAIGIGIAAVIARRASHARRTFVVTSLGLTALSFVPDLTADATTATKLVLMATHVIAAAIVIPALASRLDA